MTEVDEAFALAQLARDETSSNSVRHVDWRAICDTPTFIRQVEVQIREAVFHARVRSGNTSSFARPGSCTPSCTSQIVHFNTLVFACNPNLKIERKDLTLEHARDPSTHSLLHVCVNSLCPGFTDAKLAAYHWHDRTTDVAQVCPVGKSHVTGGGVHWCPIHTRAHVCTSQCRFTVKNNVGYNICVLSGRTMAGQVNAVFGQGTVVMTDELDWQRRLEQSTRHETLSLQRSALAAVEDVVETGDTTVHDRSPTVHAKKKRRRTIINNKRILFDSSSTTTNNDKEEEDDDDDDEKDDSEDTINEAYIDVDEPARDLFDDSVEGNTFGDGISVDLARWYAQAYATTHLLLFSDERNHIEETNRLKVVQDIRHRIMSYITGQRKARLPVSWALMRQIEQRVFNARRIYPVLLVPLNGKRRMTAYFSLVCIEFYLQLVQVVMRIVDKFDEQTRAASDALQEMSFATVAPNILDLMHEGLKIDGRTIIEAERTLSIYPESQTIEALGIPQKTCTEVKKVLKKCVVAVAALAEPLNSIRTTHLDILHVMFGNDSVVMRFLAARRLRLGLNNSV